MLENFEKLKLEGIEEREKLEILLKLVIPEEQREIYERRYDKIVDYLMKILKEMMN